MTERALLQVGINEKIIGKPGPTARINQATDWHPAEIGVDELIEHVQHGHAFGPQYKAAYRNAENFLRCDVVAADIDAGLTLAEAVELPFVKQYASFIYTTASHTDEQHRFRIVFCLENTVDVGLEWANCLWGLAMKLVADTSMRDAARGFYGSVGAQVIRIGNTLPQEEINKLTTLGRDQRARRGRGTYNDKAITSSLLLDATDMVVTADGYAVALGELKPRTSVHCTVHNDRHPSAFVVRSQTGTPGIHCRVCNQTFWTAPVPAYDFGAFDRLVQERKDQDERLADEYKSSSSALERMFPPRPKVTICQQHYLPNLHYHPGITLVKSPKGSGKTHAMAALVDQVRKQQFPSLSKEDRPKSVLLIGHRQVLLREAANRLGLDCYMDDEKTASHRKKRFGYAICFDSLHKIATKGGGGFGPYAALPPSQYDVIIIDESEQVISHLLSETIRERSSKSPVEGGRARPGMSVAFSSLEFMLRRAKAVYALDADLGLITCQAMEALRPSDWEVNCQIVVNNPMKVAERRTINIYEKEKDLHARLIDAIKAGKRCFVPCNSKKNVERLAVLIEQQCGTAVKMMAITSDNSRNDVEARFVQNIVEEFPQIQVLVCSPSLGTGVDITFPDGRCEVDEVIGFFTTMVNTHTDIDQQLSRVRNPGAVSVWFGSGNVNYETNFEVIQREMALSGYVPSAAKGHFDEHGAATFDENDPLLRIVTHVMVARRESQKNLIALFRQLRERNGWVVHDVEPIQKVKGNKPWSQAKLTAEQRRIQNIVSARNIDSDERLDFAIQLRGGVHLKKADRLAIEKYDIRRAYDQEPDHALVELDDGGKLRKKLRQFRHFTKFERYPHVFEALMEPVHDRTWPIRNMKPWMLAAVALGSTGLIRSGKLVRFKTVRADELELFKEMCAGSRAIIEEIMHDAIRDDYNDNPVRQLNVFLDVIGLKVVADGKRSKDGRSAVVYRLDWMQVEAMRDLAGSFSKTNQLEDA